MTTPDAGDDSLTIGTYFVGLGHMTPLAPSLYGAQPPSRPPPTRVPTPLPHPQPPRPLSPLEPLQPGVALGKVVEHGYESAANLAKSVSKAAVKA